MLLLGCVSAFALLYVLGRLKLLYFHQAFGVDLASLELALGDYLFESWFTAQNLLFFVLVWWIVLKTRSVWAGCLGVAYALIPLSSHYAFAFPDSWLAALLIGYRHTLLKLIPCAMLAGLWLCGPTHRKALRDLSWPVPPAGRALFALITLAWAVSSAKHFGSFDANRAMQYPGAYLLRVQLGPAADPSIREASQHDELYLLHANADRLILWDRTGFTYGSTSEIKTLVVPRSAVEWLEGRKQFQVQPGSRFL
jgi:hypothetical protein